MTDDEGVDAQQRPGREPRRHSPRRAEAPSITRAQQRPGREPRRHQRWRGHRGRGRLALNKGRGVNPGDTRARRAGRSGRAGSLNKGRGVNPGDTARIVCSSVRASYAQQRPGREPRRHVRWPVGTRVRGGPLNKGRGVNPGDTANSATRAVLGCKRRAFPYAGTCSTSRTGSFYGTSKQLCGRNSRERAERQAFACFRPESPRVRRPVRGPTAVPVHGLDCDRTGAWHLAVVQGSGRRSPNRGDCR